MTKLAGEIAAELGQELLILNLFMNNETTKSSLFLGLLTRFKNQEGDSLLLLHPFSE